MPYKTCPSCNKKVTNALKICLCSYKFDKSAISLLEKYPELCLEWDYNKNDYSPNGYTPISGEKVYWICNNNHSFSALISNRTGVNKTKCPYCSNKIILIGYNDLLTLEPELLKEWDYELNLTPPNQYPRTSNKKVHWICKNGHKFYSKISNRVSLNRGCPYCTHQKIITGVNDLKTLYPHLMNEWDFNKNKINPENYFPASKHKVYWICNKKHSYKSKIANRTLLDRGCPICCQSKGERKITYILNKLNIEYISQHIYSECIDKRILKFDFYLPKYNLLIEYQGIQHYPFDYKNSKYNKSSRHTDTDFIDIIKKDKIKKDYCTINNINILYIPYTQYANIESLILNKIQTINKGKYEN
jgi:hypothetical protein